MNTQARVQRLQSGQALQISRRSAGPVVLSQGELLVQAPASWLGGTVVLSPPVRFVAPAVLPAEASGSAVALRESTVVVHETARLFAPGSMAAWIRRLWGAFQHGRKAQGRFAG